MADGVANEAGVVLQAQSLHRRGAMVFSGPLAMGLKGRHSNCLSVHPEEKVTLSGGRLKRPLSGEILSFESGRENCSSN